MTHPQAAALQRALDAIGLHGICIEQAGTAAMRARLATGAVWAALDSDF